LQIVPDFLVLIELKLACLIHLNQEEELASTVEQQQETLLYPDLYGYLFNLIHKKQEVDLQQVHSRFQVMQKAALSPLFGWDIVLLVAAGLNEEAISALKVKIKQRMGQFINFKHEPFFAMLRSQPQFQNLITETFPDSKLAVVSPRKETEKEVLAVAEASTYDAILLDTMENEKYYLSSELSLKELSENVDLHPNKLSWLLNERIHKNFYDFVNSYRLKEFQARAIDKENAHLSILGLAYESGFNSKSVFNDYFKKATGMTPKDWINKNKG